VEEKTFGGTGLPVGTIAPGFELPDLAGAKHSLAALLEGEPQLVLMFVSPHCKPCLVAAANLTKWTKQLEGLPKIVLITHGSAEENAAKLKGNAAAHVLVQRGNEVAQAFDCTMTPNAILLGGDGTIRTEPAIGGPAIWELLSACAKTRSPA
jgi:peroxiredoxin